MIIEMTKYSIILMSEDVDKFLADLQTLGMVDVTRKQRPFDKNSGDQFALIQQYNKICRVLKNHADPEGKVPAAEAGSAIQVLKQAEKQLDCLSSLQASLRDCQTLEKHAAAWGEFDSADLDRLDKLGLIPRFYAIKSKKFDEALLSEYPCEVIAQDDDTTYLIALQTKGEDFDFPYAESDFPKKSVNEYAAEAKKLEQDIESTRHELASLAACIPMLEQEQRKLAGNLDLYFASSSAKKEVEDTLSIIEGFAPTESDGTVKAFLDEAPVVYLADAAVFEDNPSAEAFADLLREGPVTVDMHDYGNFEKVGPLPQSLPANDEQITTSPGDVILYQGDQITIYYGENTWSFTRLAHVEGATRESLLSLLGEGDPQVTFSLA